MVGIEIAADDDAGEEAVVFLIAGGDVAAAKGLEEVLAGLEMVEAEAAIF